MTVDEAVENAVRERRAVNAGLIKAALWLDSEGEIVSARRLLTEFGITADDMRKADAVERIEHYGATIDDALDLVS